MSQPNLHFTAVLGDIGTPDYDGALLLVDESGVYPPKIEFYSVDEGWSANGAHEDNDDRRPVWVYRITIERDPTKQWWWKDLDDIAANSDVSLDDLADDLLSEEPLVRARAFYYSVLWCYVPEEFDGYPLGMTLRKARKRVSLLKANDREAFEAWCVAGCPVEGEEENDDHAGGEVMNYMIYGLTETEWSNEAPVEPGIYWFTGWTSEYGLRQLKQSTILVTVYKTAEGVSYSTPAEFVYPRDMKGKWAKADVPLSPQLNKEDYA